MALSAAKVTRSGVTQFMTPRLPHLVALSLAASAAAGVLADSPQQVLRQLGSSLAAIRASTSPQPATLQHPPDVKPLLGTGRRTILSQLGVPDNCAGGSEAECMASPAWNYSFIHLPPGRRAAGPELMLLFNERGAVRDAQWSYSR
jgi:hypothetical protein